MNWEPVESSLLTAVAHEGTTLFLRFKGNKEYSYANVTDEMYRHMREAPSIGKFFMAHIKNDKGHPAKMLLPVTPPKDPPQDPYPGDGRFS